MPEASSRSSQFMLPVTQTMRVRMWGTMRFGSTAKVLLKCKLKYYRISECGAVI